ncbi:MAG: aldo/keto reductase [Kiritimatiellaeota bacterium]|nr:aldo/keto reductase [Kiritimatiellota bacterium]
MAEKKIRWGLVATGAIAQAFARGVKQSATGELYAAASRDMEKAKKFAEEYGALHAYGSYEAMLADANVDAVYVSTPHPMHLEWVIKAFNAGKHVLCEKPAGINQWELQRMLALAAEKKLFFMEAYMYRCHPQIARLVELIREGAIGKVGTIQATFSFHAGFDPEGRLWKNDHGGGGILDVGGYTTSVARLIAGAALGKDFADPIEVKGFAALHEVTRVDTWASALLHFDGGIIATVHTGVGLSQENGVRVFGSEGSIVVPDPYAANRTHPVQGKIIVRRGGKEEVIDIPTEVTTYAFEADVAGNAIRAGRIEASAPAMTWADSLGNLRTQDAWRDSAKFVYDSETHERVCAARAANVNVVRPDAPMTYCDIKGLGKPMAKLVMGTMAARSMVHADALYGAYYEQGGNAFDTAHVYGKNSSTLLGAWVNANGIRDKVVIIAKGVHTPQCFPNVIRPQLDEQLGWLGTSYADIYMMHRDNPDIPAGEFIEALNELVREGKIRVFGGSNWSLDRVAEANAYAAKRGLQGFSVISNNLALAEMVNPVWPGSIQIHAREERDRIAGMGLTLLAWSAQARGFFVPAIARPDLRADWSLVNSWYSDDNFKRQARAIELAQKYDVEPINIALAWVMCQDFPCLPLIGPATPLELHSTLKALPVTLTPAELRYLDLEPASGA